MAYYTTTLSPHSHTSILTNKNLLSINNNNTLHSFNHLLLNHSYKSHPLILSSTQLLKCPQKGGIWSRKQGFAMEELGGDDLADEYDDEEDEDEDRSLDLLVRFVQNIFKKVSKRARKAVRSVLPVAISHELVGFSVNGVIVLAFLWVLKAFLEVVCTLGSVVFVSILLIRGVWSGVSYLQDSRSYRMDEFDSDSRPWNGAQPAS